MGCPKIPKALHHALAIFRAEECFLTYTFSLVKFCQASACINKWVNDLQRLKAPYLTPARPIEILAERTKSA